MKITEAAAWQGEPEVPVMTPKKAMDTIENLNDVVNDEIQRKAAKKALTLAKTANQKEPVPKATSKPSLSTVGASSERPLLGRRGSFSDVETFFLHGLLVDNDNVHGKDQNEKVTANESQKKEVKFLTDDILFSVVSEEQITRATKTTDQYPKLPSSHQKAQRRSITGLWQAHQDGISPSKLKERGKLFLRGSFNNSDVAPRRQESDMMCNNAEEDVASDTEVRPEYDYVSICSSWDEEEEHTFDAWEVLNDEYAADFGFDYNSAKVSLDDIIDDQDVVNNFIILGTSLNDKASLPHVLSPPLMDALSNFVPTEIRGENFWMRYSLTRDGASIETLKQYVRAATYTIMAIETRNGEVFGSFTSHPWRNNYGFFGNTPAFVWKMRHSRRSKCASLFDQAQLESEIDVFMATSKDRYIQMCRHDALAVGGDDGAIQPEEENFNIPAALEDIEQGGFAIALEEDLMCGTTSPSRTFKSPALYGPGDKSAIFDVAGLEIWSFTPCADVNAAERLEMTKYFIEESSRGSARSTRSTGSRSTSEFSSTDLSQERFYRRVGDDLESEERRQRWQYTNMMNPVDQTSRGFGATPRFVN